jgi:hypothetical protein
MSFRKNRTSAHYWYVCIQYDSACPLLTRLGWYLAGSASVCQRDRIFTFGGASVAVHVLDIGMEWSDE